MVFTDLGKGQLMRLLTGNTTSYVTAMAWGTQGITASATDTALFNEVQRNSIASTTNVDPEAELEGILEAADANGLTISEVGLYTSTTSGVGKLVARAVFGGILKDSETEVDTIFTVRAT